MAFLQVLVILFVCSFFNSPECLFWCSTWPCCTQIIIYSWCSWGELC